MSCNYVSFVYRAWETRERRKAKEYEKEREKDRMKEEERECDAKRLKEFLEDYDDERDDVKYYKYVINTLYITILITIALMLLLLSFFVFYVNTSNLFVFRGRELQKRVSERLKEAEMDSRDRLKEKEEIEELKNRIFSGEHEDPSAEFEKV